MLRAIALICSRLCLRGLCGLTDNSAIGRDSSLWARVLVTGAPPNPAIATNIAVADEHDVALLSKEGTTGEIACEAFVDRGAIEREVVLGERQLGDRHLVFDRVRLLLVDLGFDQIANEAMWLVLALDRRSERLVIGGSHAVELELAHHVENFGSFHDHTHNDARSEALAETVGRDGKVKATTPHNDNLRQAEVAERSDAKGAWIVEAIGHYGELYQAIFAGPNAADCAKEYAAFKYWRRGGTRKRPWLGPRAFGSING